MLALVLHEIGEFRVEEREDPTPAEGEVLIRVSYTGICGSDIHGYTGENGRRIPGQIMGHESVGRVAALGAGAESAGLTLDQVVTFNPVVIPVSDADSFAGREQHSPNKTVIGVAPHIPAAFAEYVVVPARNVVPLPATIPIEYGALVEPLAVAVHAVRRILQRTDERALVIGGGPIGQSAVLALRMEGVKTVYVSEVDPARRALCSRLGATVLNPTTSSLVDALVADGGLVDITIDAVGITPTVSDALNATKFGGNICLVGMGSPQLNLEAFRLSTEERSLVGSFTYSAQDFTDAAAYIASGAPEIAELISREVTPHEANATFAALSRGDGTAGKVLVRFAS
ncbi:zinc-binding dehydrogenase [Cryobacterium sp. M91]|uniref:zinc-dependent alcohol dehydrogenase n=1 Tax=Cryobacterium sp. M91 TaxID=2048294 RepID=UPI000CE31271|nr:alcohol dehydrogenase catalytic domain-containing protein [Cryobacterium sp. M91]